VPDDTVVAHEHVTHYGGVRSNVDLCPDIRMQIVERYQATMLGELRDGLDHDRLN
jgi:hypothetical protein